MDDDSCSVAASGNFPTSYIWYGHHRRMTSVRHPRHIEGVKDRLREILVFFKQWPCIRGINLDDEPSCTWYKEDYIVRADKAPEEEKFWGLGDYNEYNFHYLAGGHPPESVASYVILAHSIKGNKPNDRCS